MIKPRPPVALLVHINGINRNEFPAAATMPVLSQSVVPHFRIPG
jgi:hypothetical protein